MNQNQMTNMVAKVRNDIMQSYLLEFNDEITRASITKDVECYMESLRTPGNIQEYRVICDETNNTPAIVNSNNLMVDIFVKPQRSLKSFQIRIPFIDRTEITEINGEVK